METENIRTEIPYRTWRRLVDESHIQPCAPKRDGITRWKFNSHFGLFIITINDQKVQLDFEPDIEPQEIQALHEAFGFNFVKITFTSL